MSEAGDLARATALVDLGRFPEAVLALHRHLVTNPEDGRALCLLARALISTGELAEAYRAAHHASTLRPDDEWPFRLMSIILSRQHQAGPARQCADIAITLSPQEWLTYLQRAQVDINAKTVGPQTFQVARMAVYLAPNEATAHHVLGLAFLATKDHPAAERELREALRLDPQDEGARNDLGRVALARRRLGAAASEFAGAAALNPHERAAAHNLTVVGARWLRYVHYVLFVTVVLGARVKNSDGSYSQPAAIVCWVVAALLIGFLAYRTWSDTRPETGRLLRIVARLDRLLAAWAGCLAVAFLSLTVAAVTLPGSSGAVALVVGAVAIFIGVGFNWIRVVRSRRRTR